MTTLAVERTPNRLDDGYLAQRYRHLRGFDRTEKFSTWIYTIASNLAKNEIAAPKS
jgi:DNA-directed RNA polymerase specialized sigma24 family protein